MTVPQEIEKVLRCFEILGLDDFRQDSGQPDRVDVERNEAEEQASRDHFDQNLCKVIVNLTTKLFRLQLQ